MPNKICADLVAIILKDLPNLFYIRNLTKSGCNYPRNVGGDRKDAMGRKNTG